MENIKHGNKLTNEIVISQFILKNKNQYDYSKVNYCGDNIEVIIICPIHGEFKQTPSNHKRGQKCPKCCGKNLTTDEIIEQLKIKHNNLYDYSKIIDIKKVSNKIKIICPIHCEFEQTVNNHKRGQGCKNCSGLEKPTYEKLIIDFTTIHGNKYNYSNVIYQSAHKKIKIICPIHGEFEQTPNNHKNGNGCPICKLSKGENDIKIFLEKNNIKYTPQYKFENCKNKLRLPFDFYLPKYNTCIEYNGLQHYKPIEHFGSIKGFTERQINDKIKMEYCNKNNIPLIVIKYNDNINSILSKLEL